MTNVRSMEIGAYMTNIWNPTTSGTIQSLSTYLFRSGYISVVMP